MVHIVSPRACRFFSVVLALLTLSHCTASPAVALPGKFVIDTGQIAQIIEELNEIKRQCSFANLNKLLDDMLANAGAVTAAFQWILNEIDTRLKNPDLTDEEREELEQIRADICELLHNLMTGQGGNFTPELPQHLVDAITKLCKLSPSELDQLRRKFDQLMLHWKFGAEFLYNLYCVDTVGDGVDAY